MKQKPIPRVLASLIFAGCLAWGGAHAVAQQLDFGDAPDDPYPTLLANDGARHVATGPILGTLRDAEADGQPGTEAEGDDVNGGADDEDGVIFTSLLKPGELATVTVTTSGTGPYILNAWMDFNNDGDWLDLGERIFTDTVLLSGPNALLAFPVPADAKMGERIFSRWRLNTTGGLDPTGPALDGEVEDYGNGSIHGQKWYDRNGDSNHGTDEPGLNGWTIHVYDSTGTNLITSTETGDMDLDGDGTIDRFTERGLYWIGGLAADTYIIREEPHATATQTYPPGGEHSVQVRESEIVEDLDFGNTGITLRPDACIGPRSKPGSHEFNGVYSPSRQLLRLQGKTKRPVKWYVTIENDGDVTDVIGGKARRASRFFSVKFVEFGRGNVTAAIFGGSYFTQLDPGQFRIIKATAKAKGRRLPRRLVLKNWIKATSTTDPAVIDRVEILAKLKSSR